MITVSAEASELTPRGFSIAVTLCLAESRQQLLRVATPWRCDVMRATSRWAPARRSVRCRTHGKRQQCASAITQSFGKGRGARHRLMGHGLFAAEPESA